MGNHLGISAIIAGSYSATYTRNALNNGLPIFEAPGLIDYLRLKFGSGTEASIERPTVQTGLVAWQVDLISDAGAAEEKIAGSFPLVPIGAPAQELLACGGLEPWIQNQMQLQG